MEFSCMWTIFGCLAFVRSLLPVEIVEALTRWLRKLNSHLVPYVVFEIPEFEGSSINELYKNVQLHLTAKNLCRNARKTVLCRVKNSTNTTSTLAGGEGVMETFEGAKIWWTHAVHGFKTSDGSSQDHRSYTLKIHKRDRDRIIPAYLDEIRENAYNFMFKNREMLLYSNSKSASSMSRHLWQAIHFKHPSTFDTLAVEPSQLQTIKTDLDAFIAGKEYFRRVGRPWKRGYLLYGPAGSGKSSMIAAIANYLKWDVYDLELTQVRSNSELKQLLIQTTNKSVIVIEDIDCSVCFAHPRSRQPTSSSSELSFSESSEQGKLEDDGGRITLSGLLNFTDGLWSCCGNERILIFTTNHVDKLDAALLRPGRMDLHIHMSYCTYSAFKSLSLNYLTLENHHLFPKVEKLIRNGAKITPAQVSEILIQNRDNSDDAMENLVSFLEHRAWSSCKIHPNA